MNGHALNFYYADGHTTLYLGDAQQVLEKLVDESVDCIVTSPPYYGQRDYQIKGQIGLECNPTEFVKTLVNVFTEAKRVLKPTGSLWVNIGDTYWSGKGQAHGIDSKRRLPRFLRPQDRAGEKPLCVPKQLLLIPHRFAIAMQDDGWIVRNDNVWHKIHPVPDPSRDRCASSHEYIFHFVKSRKYFYDADAVAVPSNGKSDKKSPASVWTIPAKPTKKRHSAPFPLELLRIPILATCPIDGVLLDPFCGSGTALVATLIAGKGRKAIGIDLSEDSLQEALQAIARLRENDIH